MYQASDKIKCLQIVNQWNDGTGGGVQILRGGPGHEIAEISFQSQRGRGMHFKLYFYIAERHGNKTKSVTVTRHRALELPKMGFYLKES